MADRPGTGNRAGRAGQKKEKGTKKGRKKISGKKIMVWLFFTTAFAVVCGIIGYLLIVLNGERILSENKDKFVMEEPSTIYDMNGKEVAKLKRFNREVVEFSELPQQLRDAFIATEDRRFEDHSGIDLWSIGRAIVKDVVARSAVEGGSTITQQLAKNLFLSHDKTFFRKATEASIAVALEHQFTKNDIITMYLNRIYFGKGAYGVKAAAKFYFNKPLDQLDLWEVATLAGTPKSPNKLNPMGDPEKSRERMGVVLQLMRDQGLVTQAQVDEAKAAAEKYEPPAKSLAEGGGKKYLAFIDYVVDEAEERTGLSEEQLNLGGYQIYTTLNPQAQSVMEQEFEDDSNFEKSVDEQKVQGAMVIVDHRDGSIQGMVGGRDYVNKGLNRVFVPRQPGSGFKPITVYGPALDTGDWFPWSIVMDEKRCYGSYCPSDSNSKKYIGAITMSRSVKESRNASAVWLLNEIGVKTGLKFAEKLGFDLDEKNDRNLAIGLGGLTTGVTPMQMATAYSAFANGGVEVDPHALVKIVGKKDKVEYEYNPPAAKKLMSADTAWYMTELLQAVLEKGGTGTGARIDRPVAGKTGTTQHGIPNFKSGYNRDAWFSGYTPEWTAVVWMGYDKTDKTHLLKKSSSQSAALFGKVMKAAMKDVPKSSFNRPKGVKDNKPLSMVTGLNAFYDAEKKAIQLSWNPVEGKGITYRVYRKESSESEAKRHMDALSTTGTNDLSIQPGMAYQYYITAYDVNNDVESSASDRLTVQVPAEELEPDIPDNPDTGTEVPENGGQPEDGGNPGNTPGNENGGSENGSTDNNGSTNGNPVEGNPNNGKPNNGKPDNGKPNNGKPNSGTNNGNPNSGSQGDNGQGGGNQQPPTEPESGGGQQGNTGTDGGNPTDGRTNEGSTPNSATDGGTGNGFSARGPDSSGEPVDTQNGGSSTGTGLE